MLKYLLSIFLVVSVFMLNAQTNKYFDDIKKTFDKNGQTELTKISKSLKEGQKEFAEGEKLHSLKNDSKALAKSKKASSIFKDAYRNLYTLYETKLSSLIKEAEGKQKTYFQKQMQDAKNYYRVAIYNRLKGGEEKESQTVYDLLSAAHENEILAIDVMSKMFAVINGWETTNYKVEESTYNPKEAYTNVNTTNFNTRSFSVNDPSLENSFTFNHSAATSVIGDNSDNNISENNTNGNHYAGDNSYRKEVKPHEFRIQIGTSILPANESQLKQLNKTDKPVSTYKSKVYYKYTVGSFSNFQDAKNFKNAYGLSKTYIVEYRNGKEVKFYMKDYQ